MHHIARDDGNARVYDGVELVAAYAHTSLTPTEAMALIWYREDIAGRRVLDVGCGAGRLAAYLRPMTERYVGIDVSEHMVAHCRDAYPGLSFHRSDMRALRGTDDGAFDVVFGTSNVIDAVSHAERLTVLAEIHRVLAPNGLFVFSSHNLTCSSVPERPQLARSRNPFTQVRHLADYVASTANRRRLQHLEHEEPGYRLLSDSGHNFSLLHYYIRRDEQERQLEVAGFQPIEATDHEGTRLAAGDPAVASTSIQYAARRV